MVQRFQFGMAVLFLVSSVMTYAVDPPAVPLFNGKDTTGWHEVGGGKWSVEDGVLVGETGDGSYGWLVTDQAYSDFILDLKFKLETKGNSGIQFRSHVIDGEMYGYQADIYPGESQMTGAVYEERKRGILAKTKEGADELVKFDEWNTYRIRAVGSQIQTFINGYPMVDFHDEDAIRGIIALQVHSSSSDDDKVKVLWKDISIIDLGFGGGWEPLFDGKTLNGWENYGEEKWYAEDGWIVGQAVTEKYGYLGTTEKFSNFEIRMVFQAEGTGNSGCFFHSTIDGVDITGVQAEIDPTIGNNTGGLYESGPGARGWIAQPDDLGNKAMNPIPAWNDLQFKVIGNHMVSYVNGWKAVDLVDEKQKHTNGIIALQLHSGGKAAMRWRDIYIRRID
jgi:hypothetical protein